jgi:hypothetical protein
MVRYGRLKNLTAFVLKAGTSDSPQMARKKHTQYCAVTIPPNGKFDVDHERNPENAASILRKKGHPKAITRK